MPYRPLTPSEPDRSYAYRHVWVSAAGSLILLAVYLLEIAKPFNAFIVGTVAGGLIGSAVIGRSDDYFRSLCAVGHRWVFMALGIYLFAGWAVSEYTDVPTPGLFALSGAAQPPQCAVTALFYDGYFAAIMLAIVYHAGYGYQWLRDRVGSDEEA